MSTREAQIDIGIEGSVVFVSMFFVKCTYICNAASEVFKPKLSLVAKAQDYVPESKAEQCQCNAQIFR